MHDVSLPSESLRQDQRAPVNSIGNLLQSVPPVIDGVHRWYVGQESLGGTDVAGGLASSDVLLSSLQTQPVCRDSVIVPGMKNKGESSDFLRTKFKQGA